MPTNEEESTLLREATVSETELSEISSRPSIAERTSVSESISTTHDPLLPRDEITPIYPSVFRDPSVERKPSVPPRKPSVSRKPSLVTPTPAKRPSFTESQLKTTQDGLLSQREEVSVAEESSIPIDPSQNTNISLEDETIHQQPDTMKPIPSERSSVSERPSVTQRPSVTKRPSITQRPSVDQRPSVTQRPSASRKPSVEKPVVVKRPLMVETQNTDKQPASQQVIKSTQQSLITKLPSTTPSENTVISQDQLLNLAMAAESSLDLCKLCDLDIEGRFQPCGHVVYCYKHAKGFIECSDCKVAKLCQIKN